jgi:hypothetical protein
MLRPSNKEDREGRAEDQLALVQEPDPDGRTNTTSNG